MFREAKTGFKDVLVRLKEKRHRGCSQMGKPIKPASATRWLMVLYPIIGLAALIWYLIRVLPKPSRATYPCQRIAGSIASSFVASSVSLAGAAIAFRKAKHYIVKSRFAIALVCVVIGLAAGVWHLQVISFRTYADFEPPDSNQPIGTAKGINPGRVVWVHDPDATSWDGTSGYWWEDSHNDQDVVNDMISDVIRNLTDEHTDADAWEALFRYFNQTHGKGDVGYQPGERIAIKINLNNSPQELYASNEIDASPHMVHALLSQLVNEAGVSQSSITVFDASRAIPNWFFNYFTDLPEVKFAGGLGTPPREAVTWSDVRIYHAVPTDTIYLPDVVVEADYLINVAILKEHGYAPVTLCGKNHFGSLSDSPAYLHEYIESDDRGMGTYDPQVELMGHKDLGGKTMLFLIDGLYGSRQAPVPPTRWTAPSPFSAVSPDWPSSLFASQDGVAIDSVALDFLRYMGVLDNADNYLHEAAQADAPDSGTFYDPDGDGSGLESLGVHEHWNNETEKKYSRNLGTGDGIELVYEDGVSSTLIVNRSGEGAGNVTSSLAGIDCGADCTETYSNTTTVTLTTTANAGAAFAGWTGGGCSGTDDCIITIEGLTMVTAAFAPPTAVELESFTAVWQIVKGEYMVFLEWATATEIDNLGFDIYRCTGANVPSCTTQLNDTLIPSPAPGSPIGAIYTFYDKEPRQPGEERFYLLEDTGVCGVSTQHGPIAVNRIDYRIFLPFLSNSHSE